jgi:hypothetical protein
MAAASMIASPRAPVFNGAFAVVAGVVTTWTIFLDLKGAAAAGLANRLIALSAFFWCVSAVFACVATLELIASRRWYTYLAVPSVCALFSLGVAYVAYLIIGDGFFREFTNRSDLFGLHVSAKLPDALVGWCFGTPIIQYVRDRRMPPLVVLGSAAVSVVYLNFFFFGS